jgi:hypothetical protein
MIPGMYLRKNISFTVRREYSGTVSAKTTNTRRGRYKEPTKKGDKTENV